MILTSPETLEEAPYTPGVILKAARKSASLFDPTSNAIDNIGNLSPARYVKLMASASHHPDLSKPQREHYLKLACLTADHLIIHGLADPLDGGVFSGVQYTTHALPRFSKTLRAQALSMEALYSVYQATQDPHYLKAADSILAYTQKHLSLDGGGHALGTTYLPNNENDNPCIWTLDEIQAALSEKEFQLASIAFGLNKRGNIPFIDNPNQIIRKQEQPDLESHHHRSGLADFDEFRRTHQDSRVHHRKTRQITLRKTTQTLHRKSYHFWLRRIIC